MPDSSDRFYSFPPPENPGRLVLQESSGNQVSVAAFLFGLMVIVVFCWGYWIQFFLGGTLATLYQGLGMAGSVMCKVFLAVGSATVFAIPYVARDFIFPTRLIIDHEGLTSITRGRSRQVSWQDIQDIGINAHAYNYHRVNEPILNKISPIPDQIMLSGFVIGSWGILKWGNEFGMPPQALVDYLKARRPIVCSGTKAA